MNSLRLLLAATILLVAGCDRAPEQTRSKVHLFGAGDTQNSRSGGSGDTADTLARSHESTIEVNLNALDAAYESVISACSKLDDCTLLDSSIDTGEYSRAFVQMRLLPPSVPKIFESASSHGTVTRSQTRAEDLAKPIFDQEERLAMLRRYIADLKELRTEAKNDVSALIQLASEIAKTQSTLESAEGQRAHLQLRVDTEILSINLVVDQSQLFWEPVKQELKNFSNNLSKGVASAITGTAFILPWLFVLLPLLYLCRWLWRRTKRS